MSISMSWTRLLALVALAVWVLVGPIAMAFDACDACDGWSCIVSVTAAPVEVFSLPLVVAGVTAVLRDRVLPAALNTPEPPPKSLLRSA
jgi:hypothetical protein